MFAYTLSKRDGTHPSMGVVPDSLALNGGAITSEATGAEADLRHDGTIIIGTRDDGGGGPEGNGPRMVRLMGRPLMRPLDSRN